MFSNAYFEASEDGQQVARRQEKDIIERSITMMLESDENPADDQARISAIYFTTKIWSYLLNDLTSIENESPDEFKAALISIGIFIMKHLDKMRVDKSSPFKPVREISETVAEGLN